jgi:hypothetical protein
LRLASHQTTAKIEVYLGNNESALVQEVERLLSQLFSQADWSDNLVATLGEGWNVEQLSLFLQGWNAGYFIVFSPIKTRPQTDLEETRGAYSASVAP